MADQQPKEKVKRILKLKKTPALEQAQAPVPEPAAAVEQIKPCSEVEKDCCS